MTVRTAPAIGRVAAAHHRRLHVEGGQEGQQFLGDPSAAEHGHGRVEEGGTGPLSPGPGPCPLRQLAQPGQGQGQGVLGHGPGVAALGGRPYEPARVRPVKNPCLHYLVDPCHGQLHPAQPRVGGQSPEQGLGVESGPHQAVEGLVGNQGATALAHGLHRELGARRRHEDPGRRAVYQIGGLKRRWPTRARLSQAEPSPATADLMRWQRKLSSLSTAVRVNVGPDRVTYFHSPELLVGVLRDRDVQLLAVHSHSSARH